MRRSRIFKLLFLPIAATLVICQPRVRAGEHLGRATEVEVQGTTFPQVLNQLFGQSGMPGLLNGTQPFEFRARNIMLTTEQARNFFAPANPNSMDLAALVAAVQRLPGSEVRVAGVVDMTPFQLKVERGEVRLRGLVLPQDQLNALLNRLEATPGIREARVQALVNGQRVDVKVENKVREVEFRNRVQRVRQEDRGRDHEMERRDRAEKPEHAERAERVERVEKVARAERPERIERIERPGRHR